MTKASSCSQASRRLEMVEDKTRPCPSCDGVMRRGVKEETVTFQGESLTYLQPGWHCENGDDGVLEGSDNDYPDAALHEVMARAKHSPISPLMVRAAREAVGVSQRQAGKLFGGGPTAFYKYETAKAVPWHVQLAIGSRCPAPPSRHHRRSAGRHRAAHLSADRRRLKNIRSEGM